MNNARLLISANINATPQCVWNCYSDRMHILNWFIDNDSWSAQTANNEMVTGNSYIAKVFTKYGSFGLDFEAAYPEDEIEKISAYSLTNGRRIDVMVEKLDNETKITIAFDAELENAVEGQENKWKSILNSFKLYVEQLK